MRSGVIAQKVGMTRVFTDGGEHVPVTVLRLAKCQVVAHRTKDKNGYVALQLGSGTRKPKNVTKAERGHFAVAKVEPKRKVAEFRVEENDLIPVGAEITADHFVVGQFVDVTGNIDRQGLRRRHEALEFPRAARLARRVDLASLDRLAPAAGRIRARPSRTRRCPGIWASSASPRSISRWCRSMSSAASSWSRARCPAPRAAGSRCATRSRRRCRRTCRSRQVPLAERDGRGNAEDAADAPAKQEGA